MLERLQQIVAEAVQQEFPGAEVDAAVTYSDHSFGDFSTNAAFQLRGKTLAQGGQNPNEIAARLAKTIKKLGGADIETALPEGGYVNIVMSQAFWTGQLAAIDKDYGHSDLGRGQTVQVEFISANPTGPLTLGNARGGFIGDVLASVLERTGHRVTREYYFNDAGTQIRELVKSVRSKAGVAPADPTEEIQYQGAYIDELAKEFAGKLEDDDKAGELLTQAIFERYVKPAIKKMGIKFDEWFNEKDLISGGQFAQTLERLKDEGLVYEREGAVWLRSTKLGDDSDRVLIKSNRDNTYLANDIAYHLNIFNQRNFDRAIKVWGADHAGQVSSLALTIKELVGDKRPLEFVIVQWVRLMQNGQEVKMSKRAGTYVTVEELIDQVGPDVARWFFLMRSADAQMEFDLDVAKQESQTNPLWYVMYSYARAHSILAQAKGKGLTPGGEFKTLTPAELVLVKEMTKFPAELARIAADFGVHRLTFYGQELARLFHDYYESERIIGLEPAVAGPKLHLIKQYIALLDALFAVVGITPKAKM